MSSFTLRPPTAAHAAPARPAATPSTPSLIRPGVPAAAVVALACVCAFMTVMDSSIVNVALPSMRAALQLSSGAEQWVIDAYLLTLGGFMLLGARIADLLGRRRVLQAGIAVFTLGSLAGGLATTGPMLIGARAVQGVGGSILAPSGLSILIAAIPEGPARGRAMSLYSATASAAAAIGVLLGGVLTQALSWRWVMFINVPVGIGLFAAVAWLLATPAPGERQGRIDVLGALLVTVGMGALIEGFARAQRSGWGSSLTLAMLGAAVVLLAAFVCTEARVREPLVRLEVFRLPGVSTGNLVVAANGVVLTASTFFVSMLLQGALGFDALGAGLRLSPMALAICATSLLSPRLTTRLGPRPVLSTGLLIAAAGFVWLGALPARPDYLADVLGPLLVIGVGLGLTVMPSIRAASAGIPPAQAGLAAGLFGVSRQIGAAIGIAGLVTLSVARARTAAAAGHTASVAQLHGDASALLVCAGICLLAAVLSLRLPRAAAS